MKTVTSHFQDHDHSGNQQPATIDPGRRALARRQAWRELGWGLAALVGGIVAWFCFKPGD
jgi:hypothetical protein